MPHINTQKQHIFCRFAWSTLGDLFTVFHLTDLHQIYIECGPVCGLSLHQKSAPCCTNWWNARCFPDGTLYCKGAEPQLWQTITVSSSKACFTVFVRETSLSVWMTCGLHPLQGKGHQGCNWRICSLGVNTAHKEFGQARPGQATAALHLNLQQKSAFFQWCLLSNGWTEWAEIYTAHSWWSLVCPKKF